MLSGIAFLLASIVRSAIEALFDKQKTLQEMNLELNKEIQERRHAEEMFKVSEIKFRTLVHNSRDGLQGISGLAGGDYQRKRGCLWLYRRGD